MEVNHISLKATLAHPHHIHKQLHIKKDQAKHIPEYHPQDMEQLLQDFLLAHLHNTLEATAMAMIGLRKEAVIMGKHHPHLSSAFWIYHTNTILENTLGNVPVVTNPDDHTKLALHKT